MKKQVMVLLFIFCFVLATAAFGALAPGYVMIGGKKVSLKSPVLSITAPITVTTWSDAADAALPCSISYYDYYKEGGITHQGTPVEVGSTTMPTGTITFNVIMGKSYKVHALKWAGVMKTVDLGLVNGPKTITIHFTVDKH